MRSTKGVETHRSRTAVLDHDTLHVNDSPIDFNRAENVLSPSNITVLVKPQRHILVMKMREIYHCPATQKIVERAVTHSTEPSLITRNNCITGLYICYTFYFDF